VDAQGRLGRRIREVRKERGISQGELAEKAGISLITISRIERGERDPHVRTLAQIARGLGIPAYELLRSSDYLVDGNTDGRVAD
jgi:transcriptional regulator with XRE-family HTH domain